MIIILDGKYWAVLKKRYSNKNVFFNVIHIIYKVRFACTEFSHKKVGLDIYFYMQRGEGHF